MPNARQAAARAPRALTSRQPGGGAMLFRLFGWLVVWSERHRERVRLRDLDDRRLRDLGLTREAVEREAGRPFWRP